MNKTNQSQLLHLSTEDIFVQPFLRDLGHVEHMDIQ